MATKSNIEWTESTWNPLTGCTKISPGCANCYADRMSKRLKAMGQKNYQNGFNLTLHPESINQPLRWKKPQVIFVNSMSDLFHKNVPEDFIFSIFETMENADWHIFQLLTKRPERVLDLNKKISWPDNVWMGTSIENQDYTYRSKILSETSAKTKFLSIEPLISPINHLNLLGIDWVIVGGESGPGARLMKEDWVLKIKDLCLEKKTPFFFKQWGGVFKKKNGRLLQNRTWDEMPAAINRISLAS